MKHIYFLYRVNADQYSFHKKVVPGPNFPKDAEVIRVKTLEDLERQIKENKEKPFQVAIGPDLLRAWQEDGATLLDKLLTVRHILGDDRKIPTVCYREGVDVHEIQQKKFATLEKMCIEQNYPITFLPPKK